MEQILKKLHHHLSFKTIGVMIKHRKGAFIIEPNQIIHTFSKEKPQVGKPLSAPFRPSKERLPKIEFFKSDKDKQWYFRLKSANGQVVLQSEGYKSITGAKNGIKSIENCIERAEKIILNHKKK